MNALLKTLSEYSNHEVKFTTSSQRRYCNAPYSQRCTSFSSKVDSKFTSLHIIDAVIATLIRG